jgi:hypothetical protein
MLGEFDLEFVQAQLKIISGFQKENIEKINRLINEKNELELREIKTAHFASDANLVNYLKRTPQKDFNDYCVAPVNLLRFRLYQSLEKGDSVDVKKFLDNYEQQFLSKTIMISDLPKEIQDLYIKNGWGSSRDPFQSWRDYRKVVYDYIISPTNYKRIMIELGKIYDHFKQRVQIENCKDNIKGPWGSQNNSFDDFCWIAWCSGDTMKKTVHLGLRIHPDYLKVILYVGDDFYKEKRLKNQSLKEDTFYSLADALDWLYFHKNICLELNKNQDDVKKEFQKLIHEELIVSGDCFTPQRVPSKDSLGLHVGRHSPREVRIADINSSHLYLFKIEGLKYESSQFQGSGIFKIGMSTEPYKRRIDIIKGFGLSSLLKIRTIFIKKNKAKFETQIKDFIDSNSKFYYDGEYFSSSLADDEIKSLLELELKRIEELELTN